MMPGWKSMNRPTEEQKLVEAIAGRVLARLAQTDPRDVVLGVSNRHVHLSQADLLTLFGQDAMTLYRAVRQPIEFAAQETVTVHGSKATFQHVRAMGPCRKASQVELSRTDAIALGIDAPLTQSGHLAQAGPVDIESPRGSVHLEHGAMVAARHLHCSDDFAASLGLKDQDLIKIAIPGPRGGILDNVIVRTNPTWVPEIHLDTDEANALGATHGQIVRLVI